MWLKEIFQCIAIIQAFKFQAFPLIMQILIFAPSDMH